jgi:two-component system phosphate regulon response regulator PhoB
MSVEQTTILVIEDEKDILELITFNLKNDGFNVITSIDGEEGLEKTRLYNPDLILLDIMLPGINGFQFCSSIRTSKKLKDIPVIILTALGDEKNIVKGLEKGADDYITKPFSNKVLLARIKNVLKRNKRSTNHANDIKIGGITIRLQQRDVKIDNQVINLTYTEFQILHLLMSHPGWVFTRYQIINKIREDNYSVTDRSVDFQIVGLRKKLKSKGKLIHTIRGVGYRFQTNGA